MALPVGKHDRKQRGTDDHCNDHTGTVANPDILKHGRKPIAC